MTQRMHICRSGNLDQEASGERQEVRTLRGDDAGGVRGREQRMGGESTETKAIQKFAFLHATKQLTCTLFKAHKTAILRHDN